MIRGLENKNLVTNRALTVNLGSLFPLCRRVMSIYIARGSQEELPSSALLPGSEKCSWPWFLVMCFPLRL